MLPMREPSGRVTLAIAVTVTADVKAMALRIVMTPSELVTSVTACNNPTGFNNVLDWPLIAAREDPVSSSWN